MAELQNVLRSINDDYLIGLSNKGIVKRAYKDKAETETHVNVQGDTAEVKVAEETVKIVVPLGESTCSCPSRTICRHVILGILVLQEFLKQEEVPEEEESTETARETQEEQLLKEIEAYPVDPLRKKMGKQYRNLITNYQKGKKAEIHYDTVFEVKLPDGEEKVSLLSPLDYSTCTCHKKELCIHKAEAILWCKLDREMLSAQELMEGAEKEIDLDLDQIHHTAADAENFLAELMETGLSRTSEDIMDYAERLAIQAHNCSLAEYERDLRALQDTYKQYFKRKASFEVGNLLTQILHLYKRIELLQNTTSTGEILKLAGTFHAEYRNAGDLRLSGVTLDYFETASGYKGVTVYFLEENTGEWYTYTVARPVFYDTSGRNRHTEKMEAPWGIPDSVEGMANLHFLLRNAKCDDRNRLSSTQESKAEVLKKETITPRNVDRWYYRDFGALFHQEIKQRTQWITAREDREVPAYVFIQPTSFQKARFDETTQTLQMTLYDEQKREVILTLPYHRREEWTIYTMEKMGPSERICLFGSVYLKAGKIYLKPIRLFREGYEKKETVPDAEENTFDLWQEENGYEEFLLQLLEEVQNLLEDIFHGGFATVSSTALQNMEKLSEISGQYGLTFLSKNVLKLGQKLEQKRHIFQQKKEEKTEMIHLFSDLTEYLYLCREKVIYDQGEKNYHDNR